MTFASSFSPLALSPTPASAPERRPKSRGIRRSINSRDRRLHPSIPTAATSHNASIMARPLTPCSVQEAEIETSIYFPTFARRGSQTQTLDRGQPRPFRQEIDVVIDSAEDDHDEIFELEDGFDHMEVEDEHQPGAVEAEEEEYDGEQNTFDIPPLDLDRGSAPGDTRRRKSDQTASSMSSNDLDMVWEEDDSYDNSNVSNNNNRRRSDAVLTRAASISSPTTALLQRPEPRRKSSLTAAAHHNYHPHLPMMMASLPFARRTDRVAVGGSATITNSVIPPFTNHWQAPRRGSSTVTYSRRYSTTVPSSTVSSPMDKHSPLPLLSSPPTPPAASSSSSSPPSRDRDTKKIDDGTKDHHHHYHHQRRNRSTTLASSSPSSNLSQETLLQSTASPSRVLFGIGGGRKRSSTDPLAAHPPFQQLQRQRDGKELNKVQKVV